MGSTKIVEVLPNKEFELLIRDCVIKINPHASYRVSTAQRTVFSDAELIRILKEEKPVLYGEQENGRFAVIFKRNEGFIRLIFQHISKGIEVGTFYIIDQLPPIK